MSYFVEKKVANSIYIYEVTSYWDKKKKQPRQKRKYLGKKDPQTGELIKEKREKVPKLSKDYGHIYLLQKVAEQCGLIQTLKEGFPKDFSTLLALAIFEISDGVPLYLFPYWVEANFITLVKSIDSKKLSRFMAKIGKMESSRSEFLKLWFKKQGQINSLCFDITSISSYIQDVEYIEWGYNRDDEKLPQINLGILSIFETKMPVFYQIYHGSIKDVSTLYNILKQIDLFKLTDILLILDRGFYSASNLNEMATKSLKFIIPLPKSNNLFFNLLKENQKKLFSYRNAFEVNGKILFHIQESVTIKNELLEAHLYFDQERYSEQSLRLVTKIIGLEKSVIEKKFERKSEILQHLKSTSKFFQISRSKSKHLQITRKPRIISEYVKRFGVTIMLTSRFQLTPETILKLYRKKDHVEKIFDTLKNEFDGNRLRSHSKETLDGRLFTKFIALILHSALENTLKNNESLRQYSIIELMYELKKLKVVEMSDKTLYLTEMTALQKKIFKAFNLENPVI